MVVFSIYILNKSGGLIFQQNFYDVKVEETKTENQYMTLASTFHG
jgi:hypothetical protein